MGRNNSRLLSAIILLVFITSLTPPKPAFTTSPKTEPAQGDWVLNASDQTMGGLSQAAAGPRPTLQLEISQGYTGQPITVTGNAPAGFAQVRVAWWIGEATRTDRIVAVRPDFSYEAQLTVPGDANPGRVQICAAVAGARRDSELAEFACAPFTILNPPPGNLSGTIPILPGQAASGVSADLVLIDQNGHQAAQTPIADDGSFSLTRIPPGNYTMAVEGDLPIIIESRDIQVDPGSNMTISLAAAEQAACSIMPAAAVSDILVTPGVKGLSSPGAPKTVGTYLSLSALGPIVNIRIQALLQVAQGSTVQKVEFWMVRPNGYTFKIDTDLTAPYEFNYNASLLMEGLTKIKAEVFVTGGACTKSNEVRLHAIGHPFSSPYLRNDTITWNPSLARYEFSADIPNLPGSLPARYPDPPPSIPLVGTLKNEFDAWQHFEGYLYLNRSIVLNLLQIKTYGQVLSQTILNQTDIWWNSPHSMGAVDGAKLPRVDITPYTVVQMNKTFPVYSGPIWTFAGIVTVNASIKVGFNGSVKIQGTLEPWTPAASMRLTPNVSPYLPLSIWLDLLLIIGKVGMTATTTVGFELPLVIDTRTADPVYFDDPCVSLLITLTGWAELYYYFDTAHWDIFDWEVVDEGWGSCNQAALAANFPQQVPELRSLPAPEIASGANDQMGMVYVEDITPAEPSSTPQVKVRFWDPDSNDWGTAHAVSEAGFFVKDPAIAFVGPGGEALAVWSQNKLTRAQGARLGRDVSAIFSHQEIYTSFWNGSDWTAPQQLTSNSVAEGVAAIAGDSAGGATLAWAVDTDGNLATRGDLEIVTQEWSNGWKLPQQMASAGLDAQVRVIRPAARTLTSVLVWTNDPDADLKTNADRTLMVSRLVNGTWTTESLKNIVSGADSPSVAWDTAAQTLHVAFLKRGKDEDGITDTGLGNLGQLWTGQWYAGNGWNNFLPVLQEGQPVFAEQPELLVAPGQDLSLLFRRFGDPGTPGEAGSLALSQREHRSGTFTAPLYLKPQASMNWMQAATVFNDSRFVVVSMNRQLPLRQPALLAQTAPSMAGVTTRRLSLAATAETLETSLFDFAPDPALDANLEITPLHSGAGTPLEINAVVRNLGRDLAADITLNLYGGVPGSGDLLQTRTIPGPLAFNGSLPVTFNELSTGMPQPFYVELVPGGPDSNPGNNLATGNAGIFPAPQWLNVHISPEAEKSLLLSWMPPDVPGVTGYRILRAETTQGPYELVGLSLGTFFEDAEVTRGKIYFYVVQGYDVTGNWSERSLGASGRLPLIQLFIPVINRNP